MRCRRSRLNGRPTAIEESPPSCDTETSRSIATGAADDGRRQPALRAAPCVCGDHRFAAQPARVSESGRPNSAYGHPSALGLLISLSIRLRTDFVYLAVVLDAFSRRVIGWLWDERLEAELSVSAFTDGFVGENPTARVGAPLRSWSAVRFRKLYRAAETTSGANQHEPQGQPLLQRRWESFMKTLKQEEV
jgi:hypothetical protein